MLSNVIVPGSIPVGFNSEEHETINSIHVCTRLDPS
jgi:hypothetical protein